MATSSSLITDVKDILTIVALFFGSIWGVYKFRITKPLVWRINISLAFESPQYNIDENFALIVLKITLQNVGPTTLVPGPNGVEVSVREIPSPTDASSGFVDWDSCINVLEKFDVLARYRPENVTSYHGVLSIDPGVSYFEPVAIRLERKKLYAFKVNYWHKRNSDNIVNYAYFQSA